MTASTERTVLKSQNRWVDRDSVEFETMFSHAFDPKKTAAEDAREIVWKYEKEIKAAISN